MFFLKYICRRYYAAFTRYIYIGLRQPEQIEERQEQSERLCATLDLSLWDLILRFRKQSNTNLKELLVVRLVCHDFNNLISAIATTRFQFEPAVGYLHQFGEESALLYEKSKSKELLKFFLFDNTFFQTDADKYFEAQTIEEAEQVTAEQLELLKSAYHHPDHEFSRFPSFGICSHSLDLVYQYWRYLDTLGYYLNRPF